MRNCRSHGIIRKKGFMYLKDKEIPMLRVSGPDDIPREIKYISDEELAQGLIELLRQNKRDENRDRKTQTRWLKIIPPKTKKRPSRK